MGQLLQRVNCGKGPCSPFLSATPLRQATPFHLQIAPILVVRNAIDAIDFYERAFGATEAWRLMHFHRVGHCVMRVGSSEFALLDEFPEAGLIGPQSAPTTGAGPRLTLQVDDVDAVISTAKALGSEVVRAPEDQWWGVRSGSIVDPFGYQWSILSRIEDVSPAEMQRRADELGLYPPPSPF